MNCLLAGSLEYCGVGRKKIFHKAILVALVLWLPLTAWATEYDAVLGWNRKAKLSTPVSGVVAKVNVQPGDRVKQGDILVQLDNGVIKAEVEKAKADVQYLTRAQQEAQRELERNQELYDRTVLSDHELETAHIAFAQADAKFKTAQAGLAKAEFNLRHSEIQAPFNGVVLQSYAQEGETIVSRDTPPLLIEMADADAMIAEFQVTGNQLAGFANGKKATVTVGGSRYAGEVSAVGFEPVAKTSNKYRIHVRFNTKGKLLRAGRPAKVSMP